MNNQFALMKTRRFWPLFITQLLGAFNDNLFKAMLSVMAAYGVIRVGGLAPEMLASLAAGLFILPFILFAPLAGCLADKYHKDAIIRIVKIAEIGIAIAAIAALLLRSAPLMLAALFAFGMHSAFFSPSKFSILPQHLRREELIGGNALVNTGTYLAILCGTLLGSVLALSDAGVVVAAFVMLLCAAAGFAASRFVPVAPPPSPSLALNFNPLREALNAVRFAKSLPDGVSAAIPGSAWFFFTGALLLSQLPNYTRQTLGVDTAVLALFMAIFSLGVGLGGLLNNRLLRARVEATFVPVAALAIAVFSLDLFFASRVYGVLPLIINAQDLMGVSAFLSYWSGWRIILDLLGLSIAGGLYVVPLKSIMQDRAAAHHRARVLAASSVMDALFMLMSSVAAILLFALGLRVQHMFMVIALGSVAAAVYIRRRIGRKNHG